MNRIEWNIKDLFEKDKNNNEDKTNKCSKKINYEEKNDNDSYSSSINAYKTPIMVKKTNQTSENNHYFLLKKNRNSFSENAQIYNKLNKKMNHKLANRLTIKLNSNLNKNNDSYINSGNDKTSNKFNFADKETKSSGLLWKCVKNVYTSFTTAVKKNIFINDKNLEDNHISKEKSISNNSRIINKKMKIKKYKDTILNESCIFSKRKNDLISDKYMNKNSSYDIKIIKEKNLKNGILLETNKNKNDEQETEDINKKIKNCYYDFFEDDIKNLFGYDDYEKVEYFNYNNYKNKQDIQRKHNICENTNKNNIDKYNIKRNDGSNNRYSSSSSSSEFNFNKINENDNFSYDYITSNLKDKKKKVNNLISKTNSQHSLHNLYNTDLSSNKGFFFESPGDENINKNESYYFLTEKRNGNNSSDNNIVVTNKNKDDHITQNKSNILRPYFQNNNKKCSKDNIKKKINKEYGNNDSDISVSNSIDKCIEKKIDKNFSNNKDEYFTIKKSKERENTIKCVDKCDEKNKSLESFYYENIFKKKNKEDNVINIIDDEEEYAYNELVSNCDTFENQSLKNKDQDNGYKNTENYNSFIKNNEEIKKMRNEYKSLIQLIDTFIDESLNGSDLSNSLIDKKKSNEGDREKKNINNDFNKDEDSMKIIDGIYSDNKNKYIILKYDEDSLIEALEKLRIDKKKKKVYEREEEEEEKKKITKIDKSIFYKCNKKDQYETAIFILNQKNENKVLIEKFNVPLLYSQIKCLIDTQWLNDEVINFYLSMLQEYNEQKVKNDSSYFPKIFTFSTFFFQSLSSNGCYNYCKVSRWTKRKKVDIFSFDLILIPLHVGGNHWTLGSINIKDKKIKLYDSLNMPNKNFFEYIRRYIVDEAKDKKQIDINISTWEYDKNGNSEIGAPFQENGYDCGVFTCMFAKCLSFNREFDFNQNDIKEIRLKMVYEISKGYLAF
ncbi:sentrin-specific protease 1, putative [Plasmodium relictum]|uniref:Sentrin-specific protease 1, putative n=1 Tax=Plasmodium relictum TaxID=85471 RepID=A0A1J1HFY6_PLARL|nr:sentrin-specific protease 1, putative [Plasmodium relictum]CRH02765.1 sentrin-specific protease 1, putative [Plasmodium relictum]